MRYVWVFGKAAFILDTSLWGLVFQYDRADKSLVIQILCIGAEINF